jgi:hypothetical protein
MTTSKWDNNSTSDYGGGYDDDFGLVFKESINIYIVHLFHAMYFFLAIKSHAVQVLLLESPILNHSATKSPISRKVLAQIRLITIIILARLNQNLDHHHLELKYLMISIHEQMRNPPQQILVIFQVQQQHR